ncbi:hypothetical protein DEO72_LG2g5578 [Vigna unguiculata]|uniref:Uncharacterized protein n=1 Tax=Vigna unguiculata TaxID=3917 RepID=A0A4D6L9M8_VIGUN|nr:hypothetical protein DEO72_LG2g5578 [Vigna unguiculata]
MLSGCSRTRLVLLGLPFSVLVPQKGDWFLFLSEAQSRLGETLSPEREPARILQWPLSRSRLGEEGSPERKEPFRLDEDL